MIEKVRLKNVRSFADAEFKFDHGVNLVIGKNGSGKTSLLESVAYIGFGKFFSASKDIEALRQSQEILRLEVTSEAEIKHLVEVSISQNEKLIKINGRKSALSDLVGLERVVMFNPETISIVSGAPHLRRRELDVVLSQFDHGYVLDLITYRQVLKQRNNLLKQVASGKSKTQELDFWNDRITLLARKIFMRRKNALDNFNKKIGEVFGALINKDLDLVLKYVESADYERFDEHLVSRLDSDVQNGSTSIGPHRDDFTFLSNGRPMREGASRGEQRLGAVAFMALAKEFLKEDGEEPLVILDDIFSELDHVRREAVCKALDLISTKQVLISATDERVVPESLLKKANIILIK